MAERAREQGAAHDIQVLGPAPQALARLRGRHRWHVLLKGASGAALRHIAAAALAQPAHPGVRVIADVDPIEVL
jgi:primosomal protein N' (replication factor Y)